MDQKMMKTLGIVIASFVVFILVLFFISSCSSNKYTYDKLEEKMMQVAKKYYEENEKDSKADVVFVGDSLIEMYDLKTFEVPFKMMNRGIVSDKSMGVLTSLQDRVLTLKPKLVILLIGSNDICDGYSLFQIKTNINDILIEFEKN